MSGNFDFLPASAPAASSAEFPNAPGHLQRLRVIVQADQIQPRTMEGRTAASIPESRIRRAVQRQVINRNRAVNNGVTPSHPSSDLQAPTSALRSHPHALSRERYLRDRRHRLQQASTLANSADDIQHAVGPRTEAAPSFSTLLDTPVPRIGSPGITTREYTGEAEVNRRGAKRRKLDADHVSKGLRGFSYGYRGQVVPGTLKMEILSCDGGHFPEAPGQVRNYWPENVLRNDKSVYCTESNKCNIILRHQEETTFCLKKLVIKAPERGFTAPIQEGMIFVSMTSDDLLARTAQYRLRESSPLPRMSLVNQEGIDNEDPLELLGHLDRLDRGEGRAQFDSFMRGMRGSNENRPPSRRADDQVLRTIPLPVSNTRVYSRPWRTSVEHGDATDDPFPLLDLGDDSTPPPRNRRSSISNFFNVTTDCDDRSGDEEEESSPATLADRYRRDRMPLSYDSSDDSDDGALVHWVTSRSRAVGLPPGNRRSRRRAFPSTIELGPRRHRDEDERDEKGPVGILTPHASFFIEREKSMVSIKFDPPVSGKFILLKLWSPAKDQNIDIQSIVTHGFAGPRFFPAIQTR